MKNPLLPLKAYVESLGQRPWRVREYITLYRSPHSRFSIQVENCTEIYTRLDRSDALAEQGIYDSDEDSKELAKDFVEKVCDHLSVRDMEHLRAALDAAIKDWYAQRDALNDKK